MSYPTTNSPNSRQAFKDYCLRKLGYPVIEINVDDEQIEDRIDDALQYYWEYHYDGQIKTFVKHQITKEEIERRWIDTPETLIGINSVHNLNSTYMTSNQGLFSLRYQFALNELVNLGRIQTAPFIQTIQSLELIDSVFSQRVPFRFNKHTDRLYLDADLSIHLNPGDYVIIECYLLLNPDEYSKIWRDRWLQRYATAQIKLQWGNNLKLYEGIQMLGGVTFNGQKIYDEALEEITTLEQEMIGTYSTPPAVFIG